MKPPHTPIIDTTAILLPLDDAQTIDAADNYPDNVQSTATGIQVATLDPILKASIEAEINRLRAKIGIYGTRQTVEAERLIERLAWIIYKNMPDPEAEDLLWHSQQAWPGEGDIL